MNKLLAALIAGLFATAAMAQTGTDAATSTSASTPAAITPATGTPKAKTHRAHKKVKLVKQAGPTAASDSSSMAPKN